MKALKALAVVGLGLSLAGVPSADAKDWKTVKIATEGAFRPWNFVEGGKLNGLDVELAGELCKRMQVTCEVMAQDWDGIIPALQAGKYDAIIAAMTITPKRREVIDFSRTYAIGPHGFAVQKAGPLANLPGARTHDLCRSPARGRGPNQDSMESNSAPRRPRPCPDTA